MKIWVHNCTDIQITEPSLNHHHRAPGANNFGRINAKKNKMRMIRKKRHPTNRSMHPFHAHIAHHLLLSLQPGDSHFVTEGGSWIPDPLSQWADNIGSIRILRSLQQMNTKTPVFIYSQYRKASSQTWTVCINGGPWSWVPMARDNFPNPVSNQKKRRFVGKLYPNHFGGNNFQYCALNRCRMLETHTHTLCSGLEVIFLFRFLFPLFLSILFQFLYIRFDYFPMLNIFYFILVFLSGM